MHALAGLDTLDSGRVILTDNAEGDDTVDLTGLTERQRTLLRRDRIGFVFQAVQVVGRNADVTVHLPYAQLLLALAAAGITGVVAGLVPAGRAARTDVLTAIATE